MGSTSVYIPSPLHCYQLASRSAPPKCCSALYLHARLASPSDLCDLFQYVQYVTCKGAKGRTLASCARRHGCLGSWVTGAQASDLSCRFGGAQDCATLSFGKPLHCVIQHAHFPPSEDEDVLFIKAQLPQRRQAGLLHLRTGLGGGDVLMWGMC